MENAAEKIFTELKEELTTYAGLKLRFLKLTAIERTARYLSVLSHGILLFVLAFFTIFFLFIALGFYLGEVLDNVALGFLIVGGIYFLLALGSVWARRRVQIALANKMINALLANDYDDDNEDQTTDTTGPIDFGETGNPATMSGVGNEN